MDMGAWLLGSVIAGVALFLWGGATQALTPWGIRAVKSLKKEELGGLPAEILKTTPPSGMYGVFNEQVAVLMAVKPGSYYNTGRYFALEFATQLAAGALLSALLLLTRDLGDGPRLLIVALVGLLGQVSIDAQYWNWWGFSTAYALGFTVNRLLGYLLVGFILVTWIL